MTESGSAPALRKRSFPFWNNTDKPLRIRIERAGVDHFVPAQGQALVALDDGYGQEIVIGEGKITIWTEGPFDEVDVTILEPFDGPVSILTESADR